MSALAVAAAEVGRLWTRRWQRAREAAEAKEAERRQRARALEEHTARERSWRQEQASVQHLHKAWLADVGLYEDSSGFDDGEGGHGDDEKLGQEHVDRIADAVRPRLIAPEVPRRWVLAELGDDSGVIGAAALTHTG